MLRDISLSASSQQPRQGKSYLLLGSASLPGEIDLTIAPHPRYQSIALSESGSLSKSESGLSIDKIRVARERSPLEEISISVACRSY